MSRSNFKRAVLGSTIVAAGMIFNPDTLTNPAGYADRDGLMRVVALLEPPRAFADDDPYAEFSDAPGLHGYSDESTEAITAPMNEAVTECKELGESYYASCLAAAYRKAARAADSKPNYAEARELLDKRAAMLESIVRQTADDSAPREAGRNGTYTPVRPELTKSVNRVVADMVEETETTLLRSTGS